MKAAVVLYGGTIADKATHSCKWPVKRSQFKHVMKPWFQNEKKRFNVDIYTPKSVLFLILTALSIC